MKKKIAVLMGGPSPEYEISLQSGQAVERNLDRQKFVIHPTVISRDGRFPISLEDLSEFDAVFIAMHGPFGEDGTIQGILDEIGVPYTGSGVTSSRLGMNKAKSKEMFKKAAIPIPYFELVESKKDLKDFVRTMDFPVVVKPNSQGSSVGVTVVHDQAGLAGAFGEAADYGSVLAEEFIEGREITVGILVDQALPVVEIKTKREFFDYEAKYDPGLSQEIVPAAIPKEIAVRAQQLALRAFGILGCRGFARIDMFLRKSEEILVSEVNTIPGLTENSLFPKELRAQGIKFADALDEIINDALKL